MADKQVKKSSKKTKTEGVKKEKKEAKVEATKEAPKVEKTKTEGVKKGKKAEKKEAKVEVPKEAPKVEATVESVPKKSENKESLTELLSNKENNVAETDDKVNVAVMDLFNAASELPDEKEVSKKESKTDKKSKATEKKKRNKTIKLPKTKLDPENRVNKTKQKRGVVYVGHIPLGFFEAQLKTFFTQFGKITRIKLARNSKTMHSKGYGWVEFELEEIADIVAKTMNGYMVENRVLDVKRVESDKVHPEMFTGWNRRRVAKSSQMRQKAIKGHNKDAGKLATKKGVKIPDEKAIIVSKRQVQRESKKRQSAKSRLAAAGINYDPSM